MLSFSIELTQNLTTVLVLIVLVGGLIGVIRALSKC